MENDTIAAISTPIGTGGIGIIRISGGLALNILEKIFVSTTKVRDIKSHTLTYGHIKSGDEIIDEVLAAVMLAPKTYTKEDIVEISCHGGIATVKKILSVVTASGARIAMPGEFTKRAFLNGRIDLTQAEAVMDLISAKNELAQKNAVEQLSGLLKIKINGLRQNILKILANIETSIDYPDADIIFLSYEEILQSLKYALAETEHLIISASNGKIIREGVRISILGKPNVGKSSLLNFLLNSDRAIVTDIPGTTRDVLEESLILNGLPFVISDTAGIRESSETVEKIGIQKSLSLIKDSDLILLMFDSSSKIDEDDKKILQATAGKKLLAIINKSDLPPVIETEIISEYTKNIIYTSMINGSGIDKLITAIMGMYCGEGFDLTRRQSYVITNARHLSSLNSVKESLINAIDTINQNLHEDFISIHLKDAYEYLGQVTGETVETDLIDKIFSEFCLGK